jgi:hypothetical protein
MTTPKRYRRAIVRIAALCLAAAAITPVAHAAASPAGALAWRSSSTAVGAFNAVSCPSSRFCLAVGWSTGTDYFVTYDGRSWSAAQVAERYEGEMESVSCPVDGWCAAITDLAAVTVFEGGHWSKLTRVDPNPGPPYPGMVAAISCASPRYCVAVDGQGNAETFDGTTWSRPELVDPDYPLNDVSCPGPGECTAVDGYGQAAVLTGDQWSAPRSIDNTALTGVSCARAGFCAAVDLLGRALVGSGGQWSAPVAIDQAAASPLSVSCPTERSCVAVDANGREASLSFGRWTSPRVIDTGESLVGVSCAPGPQPFCAAVDGSGGALTSATPAGAQQAPRDG